MQVRDELTFDLHASIDPGVPLDAAVLFRNSGAQIAVWTRERTSSEMLAVMSSTLLASADMILEAFGEIRPPTLILETGHRFIVFRRISPQVILALIAPMFLPRVRLEAEADRLAEAVRRADPASTRAWNGSRVRGMRGR